MNLNKKALGPLIVILIIAGISLAVAIPVYFVMNSDSSEDSNIVYNDEETVEFFNDLEISSYYIKYATKSNNFEMSYETYFKYDFPVFKTKIIVSAMGTETQSVAIGKLNSDYSIGSYDIAKTCTMGMCMDMTSSMNDILESSPGTYDKEAYKGYKKAFVKSENILGVEAKCFDIISETEVDGKIQTQKSYVCFHPKYGILLKNESPDAKISTIATDLKIGNIDDSVFNL